MTQQPQYPQYGPSQPSPQGPVPPQGPPKQPRKWAAWAGGGIVGLLAGLIIGTAGGSDSTTASTDPQPTITVTAPAVETTAPPAPATTEPPAPPVVAAPTVKDFKLTVKTLTKQCFGSAGCNVTFRILVAYSGPDLDPGKSYEVLYEVRGGEDGPIANKLTVEGGESSVDEEEMVSTPKSSTKLVAVVTDVMES